VSRTEGSIDPTHRFNGKELDPESGLYYYGGRYYDAEISRFISADPFVPSPGNPQALNRYSYTVNNPVNHIDPSGYFFKKLFKAIGNFFKGIVKNPGVFFGSLIVGIVTGGAGFVATGSYIAAGAIGGAAAGMASAGMTGGSIWKGALIGAVGGAVGGGVFGSLGGAAGATFGRVVGSGVAGGAAACALNTALNGGNFAANIFAGGITSGITAAAVYGVGRGLQYISKTLAQQQATSEPSRGLIQLAAEHRLQGNTMSDADPVYAGTERPSTFYDKFAQAMLRASSFILAAEIIHTGEFIIMGGLAAAATGGPVGVAVGVPVAAFGAAITTGGFVLGLNAMGIH
jgi:RHS repeat-associated protein